MEILEYIREDGSNPYKKWFDTLNAQAAAKVTVAKARMELVLHQGYIDGLSVTVVFGNKAQYAGNGRSPCQVL